MYGNISPEKYSRFPFFPDVCIDAKLWPDLEMLPPQGPSLISHYGCNKNGVAGPKVAARIAMEADFTRECLQLTTDAARALANLTG